MASQTQTSPPQPQLPTSLGGLLGEGHREEAEVQDELSFYEDTLRAAEDDAGLMLRDLHVRPGCTAGDNYASIVTRNTTLGVHGDGTPFCRSIIVKRAPQQDMFRYLAAFSKETDAYITLVPLMRQVCERAGMPLPLARCLHASRDLRPDIIVLEDLAALGYSMRPRQQGLDREHALLVMEALGRFHGVSLALRRLEPRLFRLLRTSTSELIFFPAAEQVFTRTLQASTTMAVFSLRHSGREDLAQRLAARAARRGVFREMCDLVMPPAEGGAVEPVFTHGDCWANNLLFRYDEDGTPCETRLIDLAAIRCSSPALDILHFTYTSLTWGVRNEHREELLQKYVDTLRATVHGVVRSNGAAGTTLQHSLESRSPDTTPAVILPKEDVLSLDELRIEIRKKSAYGLWIGLWMLPAIFFSSDIMPTSNVPVDYFSEETQAHLCKAMPTEFHRRLLDLVQEYAEDGTL